MKVPAERMSEVLSLLHHWSCKSSCSMPELQSLLGKLNFLASCAKPGRVFISRMLNVLRDNYGSADIPLSNQFLKDLLWWSRYLVDFNGVSILSMEEWSRPDQVAASDACLDACGGFCQGEFFHSRFPSRLIEHHLHINSLELLTIVVSLKLLGHCWSGKRVRFYCDNESSVVVLNSGRARDDFMQQCL